MKEVYVGIHGPIGESKGTVTEPSSTESGTFSTSPRSVEDYFNEDGSFIAIAFIEGQTQADDLTI